ncbi:hypothetical protein MATL_G00026380 [Megalops atlanticus]|uniref:THD domain-containing protein n=1 Tax=Megalops atlanticus TaxID=7932 RepID=A0A9D3QFN8_MEGAT|nr:hypothetical protein MATL_G00026380 [Megalops atlanticus]
MNPSTGHMYPPVYLVDRSGLQSSVTDPGLVPCWSFPPAVVKTKKRSSWGACVLTVLVLVLFLVLAALGLGTYQILKLRSELEQLRQVVNAQNDSPKLQRQISLQEMNTERKETKQAAHLIARFEKDIHRKTHWDSLHWDPKNGRAFTSGVVYQDGGIQVNETGLYFVYSRVELLCKHCPPKASFTHTVFKRRRREEKDPPRTLLEGNSVGFCKLQAGSPCSSSSYLGAVLRLDRLDRVFVNVSHPSLLSEHHNANFFGLFKL